MIKIILNSVFSLVIVLCFCVITGGSQILHAQSISQGSQAVSTPVLRYSDDEGFFNISSPRNIGNIVYSFVSGNRIISASLLANRFNFSGDSIASNSASATYHFFGVRGNQTTHLFTARMDVNGVFTANPSATVTFTRVGNGVSSIQSTPNGDGYNVNVIFDSNYV